MVSLKNCVINALPYPGGAEAPMFPETTAAMLETHNFAHTYLGSLERSQSPTAR